jgi:hypothetical protein
LLPQARKHDALRIGPKLIRRRERLVTSTQGFVAACLLLIALFVYTFWPDNGFAGQTQKTRLEYLLERKDQLAENLRDLNFEYKAGKYPEEDYVTQRAQLQAEQTQLLAEIERLQQA